MCSKTSKNFKYFFLSIPGFRRNSLANTAVAPTPRQPSNAHVPGHQPNHSSLNSISNRIKTRPSDNQQHPPHPNQSQNSQRSLFRNSRRNQVPKSSNMLEGETGECLLSS